jgi:hypothetical protein
MNGSAIRIQSVVRTILEPDALSGIHEFRLFTSQNNRGRQEFFELRNIFVRRIRWCKEAWHTAAKAVANAGTALTTGLAQLCPFYWVILHHNHSSVAYESLSRSR